MKKIRVHGAVKWFRRTREINSIRLHLVYIYPREDLVVVEVFE